MNGGLHKRGVFIGLKRSVAVGLAISLAVWAAGAARADIDVNAPVPLDISLVELGPGQGYKFQDTYGRPFYTYDRDTPNTSACVDACADIWIPVYPSQRNATDIGKIWKLITRPDGSRQWTYRGQPLYTFGLGDEREPPTEKDMAGQWRELKP